MEILLSYIEFTQYKLYTKDVFNITATDTSTNFTTKSHIVFKERNDDSVTTTIKQIVYDLYVKYIENGSEYQINIPHETYKKLNIVSDYDNWLRINITDNELYTIFDSCIKEMYKLLSFSLIRGLKRNSIANKIKDALIMC